MKRTGRRSFLKAGAAAGLVAGAAAGAVRPSGGAAGATRPAGEASGTVVVRPTEAPVATGLGKGIAFGLIGCGGRGRYVARGLIDEGAHLAWLCDLHPQRPADAWNFLADVQKDKPRMTAELREVLDDKAVHAVAIATPDHWHALPTVLACQAGKDVYIEKPHSHTIWESRQMLAAARKHGRIVQAGTQNRSAPYVQAARDYIRGGKLGKIGLVKVFNLKSGGPFKLGEPGKPPEGFDWDRWLGKTPSRPYHRQIFAGGWQQFWEYSGGDMAGDGIHQLDAALMILGDPPPPRSVRGIGGRYVHRGDDSQVPDVQVVSWDFGDFIMTMEESQYPRYMLKTSDTIRRNDLLPYWTHNATRVEIYGSELMMTFGRHGGGWIVQQSGGKEVHRMYGRVPDPWHYQDFLAAIRSRKAPNADIAVAHPGNVVLHMANIACRAGNGALSYDAAAGTFDNDDANKLIKGSCRKGYEVPEQV